MSVRKLWSTQERSSISPMDSLRKSVIYLLVATLPLSSWASSASLCDGERSSAIEEIEVDAHAHHDSSENVDHRTHHASDTHTRSAEASDASTDCPCCDDCVAICTMTAGSLLVSASVLVDSLFNLHDRLILLVVDFRQGPPPQSLFRPPISQT